MGKTVTIGIPVYNVEKYVRDSLLSALNQTYADIDYLIVDDRGQDHSMSIVRELVAEHPRGGAVRIIEHERNFGIAATRNTILGQAHGSYLFFLDSDDVISQDCIATHVNYLEKYQCDFTCGSSGYVNQNGERIAFRLYENVKVIKGGDFCMVECASSSEKVIQIPVWNRLYRLDFLENNNIKCVPNLIHEDIWFTWQVMLSAKSCVCIPIVTYWYYEHPASICNNPTREATLNRYYDRSQLIEMIVSSVKTNSEIPRAIRQLLTIYIMKKALSYSKSAIKEELLSSMEKRNLTRLYTSYALRLFANWTIDLDRNWEMLKCVIRLIQYRWIIK